MKLEVNSEALPLRHPSLAERCLQGDPPQRMIDCLSLTPYQGWDEHFGARVRLICHFQIPLSLSPTRHSLLLHFHKRLVGNCRNTKNEVNELMGSHCGRFNPVGVLTKALFLLCFTLLLPRHWNSWAGYFHCSWRKQQSAEVLLEIEHPELYRWSAAFVLHLNANCKCTLIEAYCLVRERCDGAYFSLFVKIVFELDSFS